MNFDQLLSQHRKIIARRPKKYRSRKFINEKKIFDIYLLLLTFKNTDLAFVEKIGDIYSSSTKHYCSRPDLTKYLKYSQPKIDRLVNDAIKMEYITKVTNPAIRKKLCDFRNYYKSYYVLNQKGMTRFVQLEPIMNDLRELGDNNKKQEKEPELESESKMANDVKIYLSGGSTQNHGI